MNSWNRIVEEVAQLNRPDALDVILRQRIDGVRQVTGRHLVVFAVDFTTNNPVKAQVMGAIASISIDDKDGFDEITRSLQLQTKELDILLHSPGGSAEATESIVEILRARFSNIRFIVPNVAKSAATMLALSGEQLLLDERSELGPIDPQFILSRDNQVIVAPAQAIQDQFETAQAEINEDPTKLPSWVPILREYGPSLLAQCRNQLALAEDLVSKWLRTYMFAGDPDAQTKAERIARYLNNHNNFRSHGRRVGITELQGLGLDILDMRTEPQLHEAVRDLYSAIMFTFNSTGVGKMYMNSLNEASMVQLSITPQVPPEPAPQLQQPEQPQRFPSNRNPSQGKRRKNR